MQQRQEDRRWSLDLAHVQPDVHRVWQDQACFRQWWALYCQEKVRSFQQVRTFPPRKSKADTLTVCLQWWRFIPGYQNTKSHESYPTSLRIILRFKCIGYSGSPQKPRKYVQHLLEDILNTGTLPEVIHLKITDVIRMGCPHYLSYTLWVSFTPSHLGGPWAPSYAPFTFTSCLHR